MRRQPGVMHCGRYDDRNGCAGARISASTGRVSHKLVHGGSHGLHRSRKDRSPPPITIRLPVVLTEAKGVWVDGHGRSALSRHDERLFGRQPRPRPSAHPEGHDGAGLDRLAVTSRAYHTELLGPFLERLVADHRPRHGPAHEHRRGSRGNRHQGGPALGLSLEEDRRRIAPRSSSPRTISMAGRRPSSASRRTNPTARASAPSPAASGSCRSAMRRRWSGAITENTCAVLIEPIQGEAGIVVPPEGYLGSCAPSATGTTFF